ncbi:hypothetical protein BDV27DRAFT_120946 [Aspergillus caelatus]|uniref:Uncharacterized protein n=1 Tax=Aspergillus caelatus TaxID=61420 RepID=A0A5N7AIB3_9EURO|nr:uncharacterized protein BDV27DRAFT_120946 [Aspergillus caelatus]KAE8369423.1 hypothetical protein BDV27DRAFT_120946 [Aspergillus caelatus]
MLRYAIHTTYKYRGQMGFDYGITNCDARNSYADYVYVYGYVLWFDMSLYDFWVFLSCCFPLSVAFVGKVRIGVHIVLVLWLYINFGIR